MEPKCNWKSHDAGSFGCPSKVYISGCGKEFDPDLIKSDVCPKCNKKIDWKHYAKLHLNKL